MHRPALAFVIPLAVACGGPRPTPPTAPVGSHGGDAPTWAPTMAVAAKDVTGWLALAPAASAGDVGWLPVSTTASAVFPSEMYVVAPAPGSELVAVPTSGGPTTLMTAAAPVKVVYGCNKPQDSVGFTGGASLAPGVVWLLPSPLPAGWAPTPVPVEPGEATAARRQWQVGALAVTQTTAGGKHGETTIAADGRTLHTEPFESDLPPVDLSVLPEPGVPELVAAWSLAPDGPTLLAMRTPHEDLFVLDVFVVGLDGAEQADTLSYKLYHCGF